MKRINQHSFSINGYVGGYQDVVSKPSDLKNSFIWNNSTYWHYLFTAYLRGGFVQGIEIGNVVNHFLWTTTDKIEKRKLSFKEVFSPGDKFFCFKLFSGYSALYFIP